MIPLDSGRSAEVSGGNRCLDADMQTGARIGYGLWGSAGISVGALGGAVYHYFFEG